MSLALPKPTREDRNKKTVDTSELAFRKEHFDRDGAYRAWVRQHRCALAWLQNCAGSVEAAHLDKGGRGIKGSDASCVPLCQIHHREVDTYQLTDTTAELWQKAWELREVWHSTKGKSK